MKVGLKNIQTEVERAAEAIAAALGVETEVVDHELTIVAGTGRYRERIGQKEEGGRREAGYIYGRVLTTGNAYIVEDARNDPQYDPSVLAGVTEEVAEICAPILYQGEAVGVIGLVAFNERQRTALLSRKDELLRFVRNMGELLSSKLAESAMFHDLQVYSQQLQAMMESVPTAILAIDQNGVITHCNRNAAALMKSRMEDLAGLHLSQVWPQSSMLTVLFSGEGYKDKEEEFSLPGHGENAQFVVTSTPIVAGSKVVGVVATFKHIADVHRLAYDITHRQRAYTFTDIMSTSPSLQGLCHKAQQVAGTDSTILITGESGTGKDLLARAIHHASKRREGPFIAVNCGAIPDSLLESELFGYESGAFTGAQRGGKAGKFELASGGTIFLDEMGDLPLHLQVKLLHVLQHRVVERVGGRRPIPVDVRVIAATNRDLEQMVRDGEFRADLYFRLGVIPLHIPPLRDRPADIPMLMDHILDKHTRRMGRGPRGYSQAVYGLFLRYDWPGNVRELENAVEYAVHMEKGPEIQLSSLPPRLVQEVAPNGPHARSLKEMLVAYERRILAQMLQRYGHTVRGKDRIAMELGLSRATLYRRLNQLGLSPEFRPGSRVD